MPAEGSTLLPALSCRGGCSQPALQAPRRRWNEGERCRVWAWRPPSPCVGCGGWSHPAGQRPCSCPPRPPPHDSGFPRCWGAGAADQRPVSITLAGPHLQLGGQCAPGPVTSLCAVTFFRPDLPVAPDAAASAVEEPGSRISQVRTGAWPLSSASAGGSRVCGRWPSSVTVRRQPLPWPLCSRAPRSSHPRNTKTRGRRYR